MHDLFFSPAAERYFKKIKEKALKEAFREALLKIAEDPYCGRLWINKHSPTPRRGMADTEPLNIPNQI